MSSSDVFMIGCQRVYLPLTGNLLFISLNLCSSQRTPTVFVRCHDVLPPHTDWGFSYCPKEKTRQREHKRDIPPKLAKSKAATQTTRTNYRFNQHQMKHRNLSSQCLKCKDHTSNDPFSRCATSNNYGYSLNWRWQDKVGLQHEENLGYVCVVIQHDKTSDTNDNVTTKTNTVHMKRDTWQVSVHVVFLLVLFSLASSSSLIAHHIAWLKGLTSSSPCVFALISSMHEVSVTRLWALHSIQLPTLLILLQFTAALAALLLPRG